MSCPCRERFSGAKGIIYCFSKNDTVVVASFLHVRRSIPGTPVPLCNVHDCRQRQTRSISDAADPLCVRAYTRISISNVCAALQKEGGIKAAPYHGGMTSKDRIRAQNAWQSGHVKVLLLAAHCPKRSSRRAPCYGVQSNMLTIMSHSPLRSYAFTWQTWSTNRTGVCRVPCRCCVCSPVAAGCKCDICGDR